MIAVTLFASLTVGMTFAQGQAVAAVTCLEGNGTTEAPFLVRNAVDLAKVGSGTDGCTLAASYRQTADITLVEPAQGSSNHVPIGSQSVRFTGTFDGGGFTISGLVLVSATNSWGMFGGISGAVIQNVVIVDGVLTGIHANMGLLIGDAVGGTVSRSSATGAVTGGNFSGGLIGRATNATTVSNSFASVNVQGNQRTGGLTGDGANVSDSYTTGTVRGAGEVAGLIGRANGTNTVVRSFAVGAVTGTALVGGLIGDPLRTVTDSFWGTETSGQLVSAGGTGKSTAEMKSIATFSDTESVGLSTAWLITDGWAPYEAGVRVWGICPAVNQGYPFLLWQFGADPCRASVVDVATDVAGESVSVAVAAAVAAGVAGTSEAVLVRDGVVVPVGSVLSAEIGPRGGVVLTAEGLRVAVASSGGAASSSGVVVSPGGALEVSIVSALVPGSVVEAWGYSTPRLLGAVRVPDGFVLGDTLVLTVPTGEPLDGGDRIGDGPHALQLRMEATSGFEVLATGMTVGGPVPTSVPTGGGQMAIVWPRPIGLIVLFVLAGALGAVLGASRSGWPALRVN